MDTLEGILSRWGYQLAAFDENYHVSAGGFVQCTRCSHPNSGRLGDLPVRAENYCWATPESTEGNHALALAKGIVGFENLAEKTRGGDLTALLMLAGSNPSSLYQGDLLERNTHGEHYISLLSRFIQETIRERRTSIEVMMEDEEGWEEGFEGEQLYLQLEPENPYARSVEGWVNPSRRTLGALYPQLNDDLFIVPSGLSFILDADDGDLKVFLPRPHQVKETFKISSEDSSEVRDAVAVLSREMSLHDAVLAARALTR